VRVDFKRACSIQVSVALHSSYLSLHQSEQKYLVNDLAWERRLLNDARLEHSWCVVRDASCLQNLHLEVSYLLGSDLPTDYRTKDWCKP
jgi:hypothetical protein